MAEEEQPKEEPQEEEGSGEETPAVDIKKAEELAQKLDEKIKKNEALLMKIQMEKAEAMLGGEADAGKPSKPKTQEEKDEEGAKRIMDALS